MAALSYTLPDLVEMDAPGRGGGPTERYAIAKRWALVLSVHICKMGGGHGVIKKVSSISSPPPPNKHP